MTPHGFSHLYELFATFTLAYIIIDELSENPFIKLITEKILHKYQVIDKMHTDVKTKIDVHYISLESIIPDEANNQPMAKDAPAQKRNLLAIGNRVEVYFGKVTNKIKSNYTTKLFIYLNFYLLLYCIAMLFLGGIYEEQHTETITPYNLSLDYSLFIFVISSTLLLILGWIFDSHKKAASKTDDDHFFDENGIKRSGFEDFVIDNGFTIVSIFYVIVIALAIFAFCFDWHFSLNFQNLVNHHILVIVSVCLPVSNFIVYFIKANKRANKFLPQLRRIVEKQKLSFLGELENIENFIGGCAYKASSSEFELED